MRQDRGQARGYRRLLLAALTVSACALTSHAIAEIPTAALSADGGPNVPPPKANAPRAEQRTTEQRPQAEPSLG